MTAEFDILLIWIGFLLSINNTEGYKYQKYTTCVKYRQPNGSNDNTNSKKVEYGKSLARYMSIILFWF